MRPTIRFCDFVLDHRLGIAGVADWEAEEAAKRRMRVGGMGCVAEPQQVG
jgi:hypothetical protein